MQLTPSGPPRGLRARLAAAACVLLAAGAPGTVRADAT